MSGRGPVLRRRQIGTLAAGAVADAFGGEPWGEGRAEPVVPAHRADGFPDQDVGVRCGHRIGRGN